MAIEKNPYSNSGGGLDIINEEVDMEESASVELDDEGGAIVSFSAPTEVNVTPDMLDSEEDHDRNLAEDLDDELIGELASQVIEGFEADKESRSEWEAMFERGFDLLGLKLEEGTEPFDGACTAVHPVLIESAVKFQSKASQELLPPSGPAKAQIIGARTEEKEAQAKRVKDHINYQTTEVMVEYFDETERMLFHLSLMGSAITKTYYDAGECRPIKEFVPIDQFYVSYYASDLRRCERYTHLITRTPAEFEGDIEGGLYHFDEDTDLPEPSIIDRSPMQEKMDTVIGLSPAANQDPQYQLLEQHIYLDIEEGVGWAPYIVTVETVTNSVIGLRRNWAWGDIKRKKKNFFVHHKYVPGFGFYGLGLIHFLGNLTMAATASMRSLIDSGQFANLQGGFKAKGMKIVGDNDPIAPGEWKEVEATGNDIRQMLHPLPFKEPSQTLFQMLGFVTGAAQKFADSTEQVLSDASSYGPVGTTMALLEASSKFFSAIHKRLHRAQKEELKILARINFETLDESPVPYDTADGEIAVSKSDFDGRVDIVPVSDPNIPSAAHRLMMGQMALQLAQGAPPGMYNMDELHRNILTAANMPNVEKILPVKPEPQPLDPISDIMAATKGLPIRAFIGQNHDAHIQTKNLFLSDPANGGNPLMARVSPVLQANMQEHLVLKYQEQVNGVAKGMGAGTGQDPAMVEQVLAQAAQQVASANQQIQHAGTPEQQMVEQDWKRLEMEGEKLQTAQVVETATALRENKKLEIAEMKLQLDMFKEGAKLSSGKEENEKDRELKKAIATLDGMIEMAKHESAIDKDKMLKAADMMLQIIKAKA